MADQPSSPGGSTTFATTLLERIHRGTQMLRGEVPTPRGFFTHVYGDVGPDIFEPSHKPILKDVREETVSVPVVTVEATLVPSPAHEPPTPEPVPTDPPPVPAPVVEPTAFVFRPQFGLPRKPTTEPAISQPPPADLQTHPQPVVLPLLTGQKVMTPEEGDDAGDETPLHTLADFVREIETATRPEEETEHVTLRALVKRTVPLASLLDLLAEERFDEARMFIRSRQSDAAKFVAQLQNALTLASREVSIEEAVTARVEQLLDQVLTESVRNFPSVIAGVIQEARAILETHQESLSEWEKRRKDLLLMSGQMQLAVADLGFAHERRLDVEDKGLICRDLQSRVLTHIARLEQIRIVSADIAAQMAAIEMRVFTLNDQANHFIAELERVGLAAEQLGVVLVSPMFQEARSFVERIRAYQGRLGDTTQTMTVIQADRELTLFVSDTFPTWQSRVETILDPPCPSVFVRPLDRIEELRRLALFSIYFLTQRKPRRPDKDGRHMGFGIKTYARSLIQGGLATEQEFDLIVDYIRSERKKGQTENLRVGRIWLYRLKCEAEIEIRDQLETLLDWNETRRVILKGYDSFLEQQRAKAKEAEEEDSEEAAG